VAKKFTVSRQRRFGILDRGRAFQQKSNAVAEWARRQRVQTVPGEAESPSWAEVIPELEVRRPQR